MSANAESHLLRCHCGTVECVGTGEPICTAVCYCDDCQEAGHVLEALPGAPPVLDPDGGTALTLFRTTRFAAVKGSERLAPHRLRPDSTTFRMVASCCNSAMYLGFDKGPHWVSTLRNRFVGDLPPIGFRQMVKFRASTLPYPDNIRPDRKFSVQVLAVVLRDWLAMKLGR